MPITPHEFIRRLREAEIVAPDRLEEVLSRHGPDLAAIDLNELVRDLGRADLLTRFQTTYLLQDRARELRLGNYILSEKIGRGGMGTVYRARHVWMDRVVAVKVLNDVPGSDDQTFRRFRREVQAAAKLIHPNIVTAFDADESDGRLYLVMEYVPSDDLVTIIERDGPFPLAKAVHCIVQAAKGIHFAHEKGVVHRDIKPSNLLLAPSGTIKLLDMGLARFAEPELIQTQNLSDVTHKSSLTRLNQIMGTVDFMSPEQAEESSQANVRSDIYSLGCTLYYLLVGKTPYGRTSMFKTLLAHRLEPIPQLQDHRPDLPPEIDHVFARMVAKEPKDRYESMAEVVKALSPFDDDSDFVLAEDMAMVEDAAEDTRILEADPSGDSQLITATSKTQAASSPAGTPPNTIKPVGIDLGTTYSVVSYVDQQGQPQTVPNAEGELLTPSLVFLSPQRQVMIGQAAKAALEKDAAHVAEHAKRDLGTTGLERVLYGQEFPPEVLLALILKKLKEDAQARIGPIDAAVVTVPAYFDETRRVATQNAGLMAGLKVLDIINEPTAAALSFGIERFSPADAFKPVKPGETLLIYDLGGGTFDVTLLHYDEGQFRTLVTDGDVELGGLDWDQRLIDLVTKQARQQLGVDLHKQPALSGMIKLACETAKRELTTQTSTDVQLNLPQGELKLRITRDQFEQLTADLLSRTEFTVKQTLVTAQLRWNQIDRILLVGGAAKMPAVHHMLKRLSGRTPTPAPFPDEVVSHGAALHAQSILLRRQGLKPRLKVRNVNSHSLGVVAYNPRTEQHETSILIPRNTPLPAVAKKVYKTRQSGQANLTIPIIEGESRDPKACSPLGRCVVQKLPPGLPKGSPVEVTFTYRQNARLSLRVTVAGQSWDQRIQRYSGLTQAQIEYWRDKIDSGDLFEADELGFAELTDG